MIQPVQKDLFAIIGNPAGHSLSPPMMNAAFKALKVPAVYLALQVDSFPEDLETITRMGFRGLSVTLPHKEAAFRLAADRTDDTAADIGAVNTLRRRGGHWEGRNTDWVGSNGALSRVTELKGKEALVLGAGGAARAVVYGLKREGARVIVANRNVERGEILARTFECDFIPLAELDGSEKARGSDIVVQCTSLGLLGKESQLPVSPTFFNPRMVVMDAVYRPLTTPFLAAAQAAGCVVVSGLEMLLHQGVAQLQWWLERSIPPEEGIDVMREALMKALEK